MCVSVPLSVFAYGVCRVIGEYQLFSVSTMENIRLVTPDEYSMLRSQRIISDDSSNNIQKIELVLFADTMWDISTAAFDALMNNLENPNVPISVRIMLLLSL